MSDLETHRNTIDIVAQMVEDAKTDYVKLVADDEKELTVLAEPVRSEGPDKFNAGQTRVEYSFKVLDGQSPMNQKWIVSSKNVLQQMAAIAKKEGLKGFKGTKFRVSTMGDGKDRKYFVKFIGRSGTSSGDVA
jgi:hypothetical protein